jgi:hypothetical protein
MRKGRTNHPTRARFDCRGGGGKVARGTSREKKMLINDERSQDVYENKQENDNFTEEKGDISTQRNDILYKVTHILLKSSVFLSLLKCWGTNLSLPNVETRDREEIAGGNYKIFSYRQEIPQEFC